MQVSQGASWISKHHSFPVHFQISWEDDDVPALIPTTKITTYLSWQLNFLRSLRLCFALLPLALVKRVIVVFTCFKRHWPPSEGGATEPCIGQVLVPANVFCLSPTHERLEVDRGSERAPVPAGLYGIRCSGQQQQNRAVLLQRQVGGCIRCSAVGGRWAALGRLER